MRFVIGNKLPDNAVITHKIRLRGAIDSLLRELGILVAIDKEKSPIAQGNVIGKIDGKGFRVTQGPFKGRLRIGRRHFQLLRRHTLFLKAFFDGFDHGRTHGLERFALFNHRTEKYEPRALSRQVPAENLTGKTGFHQGLIQTPARRIGKNLYGCIHTHTLIA